MLDLGANTRASDVQLLQQSPLNYIGIVEGDDIFSDRVDVVVTLDPRRYNRACMVGLGGVVVKSHGQADATAFARAVELAATLGRGNLCAQVAQAFV